MPMCGFNAKMIAGLKEFGEGLYEQALIRARDDRVSLRDSFSNEITEMDIFLSVLADADCKEKQPLMGIAYLAQALYRNGEGLDDPEAAFKEGAEGFWKFFIRVDEVYYDDLRPKHPPEEALQLLGARLDTL